jgi:hypothetical protein
MSSTRLCVRVSYWSRASLSACGEVEDGVTFDLGRQRDRAAHLRAGPLGRLDDLAGRTVDQTMIERLQPDPDLLVRHDGFLRI